MKTKSMDVLREKLDKHSRREIVGRSFEGTPCLELMTLDGRKAAACSPKGYVQINDGQGGHVYAHRAALAIATGRDYWTEELVTDHRCFTRNCCNPSHLEWVTHAENSSSERLSSAGLESRRLACRRGGATTGRRVAESGHLFSIASLGGRAHAEATRIEVISRHLDTREMCWHRDQHTAARELGLYSGNISACVRGLQRRAGRYAFEHFNPDDPMHVTIRRRAEGRHSKPGNVK